MSGRPLPPTAAARRWRNGQIVVLHLEGWTQDEIARRLGLNRSTVSRVLAKIELTPSDRRG